MSYPTGCPGKRTFYEMVKESGSGVPTDQLGNVVGHIGEEPPLPVPKLDFYSIVTTGGLPNPSALGSLRNVISKELWNPDLCIGKQLEERSDQAAKNLNGGRAVRYASEAISYYRRGGAPGLAANVAIKRGLAGQRADTYERAGIPQLI